MIRFQLKKYKEFSQWMDSPCVLLNLHIFVLFVKYLTALSRKNVSSIIIDFLNKIREISTIDGLVKKGLESRGFLLALLSNVVVLSSVILDITLCI